ncbi:MAG: dihydropteroate synthase [Cytophagales bacterium]
MTDLSQNTLSINLGGDLVSLEKPIVMGILNLTPDSFYDGGNFDTEKKMLLQVEKMLDEGATIIDIGGASSKPNAAEISEREELKRVILPIAILIKSFPNIKISIDTFRSTVANAAVNEGAVMVNDISGGELDEKMYNTLAKLKVPYVLMHMKGTPQNMIEQAHYEDIVLEIAHYFHFKIDALKKLGINDIILDLGFGFAKNMDQNYELLKKMPYFKKLNLPMLVGLSRKSMIYKQIGIDVDESLNGTTTLNTIALMSGAKILRVHDVRQAVEAVKLFGKTYLNT